MSVLAWDTTPSAVDFAPYPSRLGGGMLSIALFLDEDESNYQLKSKFREYGELWPEDENATILAPVIPRAANDLTIRGTLIIDDEGHSGVIRLPPIINLVVSQDKNALFSINGQLAGGDNQAHRWGHEE